MIKQFVKGSVWIPVALGLAANMAIASAASADQKPRLGTFGARIDSGRNQRVDERRNERTERRGHRKDRREVQKDRRDFRRDRREVRRDRRDFRRDRRDFRRDRRHFRRDRGYYKAQRKYYRKRYHRYRPSRKVVVVEPRRRYRSIWIHRPYGHRYYGYGHHHDDHDAFKWLAFTAITLGVLDYMTETQQRAHESAQITATTAPVGQAIQWNEGNMNGRVTATRDGTSSSGRYCREFQQVVNVGGQKEESYGTACRQPDGSWEIVP